MKDYEGMEDLHDIMYKNLRDTIVQSDYKIPYFEYIFFS